MHPNCKQRSRPKEVAVCQDHIWQYNISLLLDIYIYRSWYGEGNGTPLQYSCLENPMDRGPGGLQSMGSLRVRNDWGTSLSLSLSCIGEGDGNPLQCSCLENPRDGVASWAAIYGVAQSQTWLKQLSSTLAWKIPWTEEPGSPGGC